MATYKSKILARSPFFITATGSQYILTATLDLYIWSGDSSTDKPASPNYTIVKTAATPTSENIVFEISQLIRDYFEYTSDNITPITFDSNQVTLDSGVYTFDNGNSTNALWVETELTVTQTTDPQPSVVNDLYLALDGYGYFDEGVNPQGTNVISNKIQIKPLDDVLIPVYLSDTDGVDRVDYLLNSSVVASPDLSGFLSSDNSWDKIKYLVYSGDADEIKLYRDSTLLDTVSVEYIDECKYTPKQIKFFAKNGLLEQIYMFKKSTQSISVSRDEYLSFMGGIGVDGYFYNTGHHNARTFNVSGSEKVVLNSGFVDELQNEFFKQLLLSEFVWLDDKPVRVSSSSLEYKTRVNDKLINYTIELEYSNNVINNIY